VLERGALDALLHGGRHTRQVERAVVTDLEPEDDRAGVLADEVGVALGDLDVLEHDVEEAQGGLVGLGGASVSERLLEIWRQQLERRYGCRREPDRRQASGRRPRRCRQSSRRLPESVVDGRVLSRAGAHSPSQPRVAMGWAAKRSLQVGRVAGN
jgi:hypothetical protein